MAEGARSMAYRPPPAADGTPRPVVPCVRLSAMMEAAFPTKSSTVDATFMATLEGVVKAFQDEGVCFSSREDASFCSDSRYVFLDIHQDAFGTTNGGASRTRMMQKLNAIEMN